MTGAQRAVLEAALERAGAEGSERLCSWWAPRVVDAAGLLDVSFDGELWRAWNERDDGVADPPWALAKLCAARGLEAHWPGQLREVGPVAPPRGAVLAVQHWRDLQGGRLAPRSTGHAMIALTDDREHWRAVVLHSDRTRGPRVGRLALDASLGVDAHPWPAERWPDHRAPWRAGRPDEGSGGVAWVRLD